MGSLVHSLKNFSKQIQFALDHYSPHKISYKSQESPINNVVIGGLGGSGIAGRIVKNYFADKLDIPIEVVSDYIFPRFVNSSSLVILSSYSGNSEETIALYAQAKARKCKTILITAGGELQKLAQEDGIMVYLAESNHEARMCLGYSLTYLFQIVFEILGQYKIMDLKKIVESISSFEDFISGAQESAKVFENSLKNKFIVVADVPFEGLATRFVQQIQENAKSEAFISILPEANHNVLATYKGEMNSNFIFLNSRSSHRTNLRFSFLKDLLIKGNPILEINIKDDSLATLFSTLYSLDWLAVEIATQNGADMKNSENVSELKQFLAKYPN